MNITELRNLIRTGEYLEENIADITVRNQWVFDVEEYLDSLDTKYRGRVHGAISLMKSYGSFAPADVDKVMMNNLRLILGLLRSMYNHDVSENKLPISDSQAVFIVHGHDNALIEDVKKTVKTMGLDPIVLREQPDKGMTIIEKLEDWLGNCKCAIILYTPCDVGKACSEEDYEPRARQNVVYEHALFQGFLGRKRIIVLKKGKTVIPGDCSGIVYISVDSEGWQNQLVSNVLSIDK